MKGFLGLLNPRASSDSLQQPLLSREEQMDDEHTQTTTDDDNKKLINAAKICDIQTIIRLLKQKEIDINFGDKDGETALMIASKNGHTEGVKELLNAGAEVDKTNSCRETALFRACASGNIEIVKDLINYGANVNHIDINGETALFHACIYGKPQTVQILIAHNADLNVKSKNNGEATPIVTACLFNQYECAIILFNHNANTEGLSYLEITRLKFGNLFSRSTKGNQSSPVATSAGEQEPMGAATNANSSRAGVEARLEKNTTLTPTEFLDPLENVKSTLTTHTVGTSPAASRRGTEAVAPLTRTR